MTKTNTVEVIDELLTLNQLIEVTGIELKHAMNLISMKKIGFENIEGDYVFTLSDVDLTNKIIKTRLSRIKNSKRTPPAEIKPTSIKKKVVKLKPAPIEVDNDTANELSVSDVEVMVRSLDRRLSGEVRDLFNQLTGQINKLSDKLLQHDMQSRVNAKAPEPITEFNPDSKMYNGPFNHQLISEAYQDYLDYIDKNKISDMNKHRMLELSGEIVFHMGEHYAYHSKGLPLKKLMNKIRSRTNRSKFWLLASLGYLASRNEIAITNPPSAIHWSESSVSLWHMHDFLKHKEGLVGNKSGSLIRVN